MSTTNKLLANKLARGVRSHKGLSRRGILQAIGASTALAPFIPLLSPDAEAQAGLPRRLIIIIQGNWTQDADTMTTGSGENFTFGPAAASLTPHLKDMSIIEGVDNSVRYGSKIDIDGHDSTVCLLSAADPVPDAAGKDVGWSSKASVDQFVAASFMGQTPHRSLELGVGIGAPDDGCKRVSFSGPDEPVPPENDPAAAFARIFGGASLSNEARETQSARQKAILDVNRQHANSLMGRLPAEDRPKLEAHLQHLGSIEQRLTAFKGGCAAPDLAGADDSTLKITELHLDILAAAMACDLTRVGSLFFPELNGTRLEWILQGNGTAMHDLSHSRPGDANWVKYTRIRQWKIEMYASLLDRLKATTEGAGTLLDQSAVVFTSPMGSSNAHQCYNVAMMIAGRAGGGLNPGRVVRYGNFDSTNPGQDHGGKNMNGVLVSLCQAMGLKQVTTFGDPQYDQSPVSEILTGA